MSSLWWPKTQQRIKHISVCIGCYLLFSSNLSAQDGEDIANFFVDSSSTNKYALIMSGPAVGEVNQERFRRWSFSLHDILARDYGYSSNTISLLYDRGDEGGSLGGGRIDGASDRESIESQLSQLALNLKAGDQLTIYMIGHGSGEQDEAKFNIVGPDITGADFAQLLEPFESQDVVVVNTTSASYDFSAALSKPGRVVISATRSATEKYDTLFSEYFIEALDNRNGDRDKNLRVSLLEAFTYSKNSIEQWYEEQGRLAAEHAGLDDNGDGLFSLSADSTETDGRLAEIAFMDALSSNDGNLSPEATRLKSSMQDTERAIFLLRGSKADYLEADYWQQMEELLVNLARTTLEFKRVTN